MISGSCHAGVLLRPAERAAAGCAGARPGGRRAAHPRGGDAARVVREDRGAGARPEDAAGDLVPGRGLSGASTFVAESGIGFPFGSELEPRAAAQLSCFC